MTELTMVQRVELDSSQLSDPSLCATILESYGCAIVRRVLAPSFMLMVSSIMKPMYDARKDKDGNVYMSHIIEDAKTDPTGKNLLVLLLQNLVVAKFFAAVRTFLNGTDLLFFTDACIMGK